MTTIGDALGRLAPRLQPFDPFERLWRWLCSVRLAIAVMFTITFATLVGTVLPQAPADVLASPLAMTAWLAKQRPKFGDLVDVYHTLDLFNVFGSWWFRGLLAFLCLEIIVCTLNRLPPMWKSAVQPRVKVGAGFFRAGEMQATLTTDLSPANAAERLEATLRRRRYQLKIETDTEGRHFFAQRFGFAPLATFINHTGLVLILIGAVMGGLLGFREDGFAIPDGKTRAVGHGADLVVLNEGFTEINHPDTGRPKDYYSDLVVFQNGVEVARHRARVNDPMHYAGINFHQSSFGNAVDMRVRDAETGEVLFEDSVAMPYTSELYGADRPLGTFSLRDGRVQVDVVGTSGMFDMNIAPGQVGLVMYVARMGNRPIGTRLDMGEPSMVGPLEFTFLRERQYAGLQVVYNPGVPVIWLACALFMIGILTVFWLPPRRIWARVTPNGANGALIQLRGLAPERAEFSDEFKRLVAATRRSAQCPAPTGGSGVVDSGQSLVAG